MRLGSRHPCQVSHLPCLPFLTALGHWWDQDTWGWLPNFLRKNQQMALYPDSQASQKATDEWTWWALGWEGVERASSVCRFVCEFASWCWESDPGPHARQENSLPLSSTPSTTLGNSVDNVHLGVPALWTRKQRWVKTSARKFVMGKEGFHSENAK